MLTPIEVKPNISNFISSLRDIGYSFDTAVADIVDNSITASAKSIDIYASAQNRTVVIIDDGVGLSKEELKEAMRLGSTSPTEERKNYDLGRFGLGLKTASFSQCKRLTVISKTKQGEFSTYRWDLDYIIAVNKWYLQEISIDIYQDEEWYEKFSHLEEGTVVLWENIDRYESEELDNKFDDLIDHLGLIFHRFLEGEFPTRAIKIFFNGRQIPAFNPYNENNYATQRKNTEYYNINEQPISITPYILPHPNKVSRDEYEKYATNDGYQKTQGFYLYREGRLLVYGTWFKLHRQSEAHKLVRIKIDINNKMDFLWQIDVKKSTAMPVPQIKEELKRIIGRITAQGFKTYKQRGNRIKDINTIRYWSLSLQNGKIKYKINKEHPRYALLKNILEETEMYMLDEYLEDIERFIPIESIIAKAMETPHDILQNDCEYDDKKIKEIINKMKQLNLEKDLVLNMLENAEGFKNCIDKIKVILEDVY